MEPPLRTIDISNYLATPSTPEMELLRMRHRAEPLIIFDIGSCEGEDSVRYARCFPRGRVFAFEPLPANQELVRQNFRRFNITNAELFPFALSDRAGTAEFHVSSGRPRDEFAGPDWNYGNKSSSLLRPVSDQPMLGWIEFKQTISVPTDTLDNFCHARAIDRIDFIHMDVQGGERLVLAGAASMLPHVGALWLEVMDQPLYQGQMLREETERRLRSAGFTLVLEERRETECDQFYVNLRNPRAWPYLFARRSTGLLHRGRHLGGRLKRAWLGRRTSA